MALIKSVLLQLKPKNTKMANGDFFFTIVDVGCGVNAFVLYKSYKDGPAIRRVYFLKTLAPISPLAV